MVKVNTRQLGASGSQVLRIGGPLTFLAISSSITGVKSSLVSISGIDSLDVQNLPSFMQVRSLYQKSGFQCDTTVPQMFDFILLQISALKPDL